MTNKEAISVIENEIQIDVRFCTSEQVDRFQTALYMAISALRAEPTGDSLTLEQLRKMDGQPVYVVFRPDNSGDKPQFWALVSADKQHDEVYLLDSMGGTGSCDEIWANIDAIYRRPPEGEA